MFSTLSNGQGVSNIEASRNQDQGKDAFVAKRALITGASRGIGKAVALSLAAQGYDLVISARTIRPGERRDNGISIHKPDDRPLPGSLEETAALAVELGVRVEMIPLDLTDRQGVYEAAEKLGAEQDAVDVIIHNGRYLGPGFQDVFMDIPIDAYEKYFEAHAIAPVILTRALLPRMLELPTSTLITITSESAYKASPAPAGKGGWGHGYAVGKGSGHSLAQILHVEYASQGLRAFNVDPGLVATERGELVTAEFGWDMSKFASPSLIGAVVGWIVTSPEADQYAGQLVEAQKLAKERGMTVQS